MTVESQERRTIDARKLDQRIRHETIFNEFKKLNEGETLDVVVDHEPDHLLMQMEHVGLPVNIEKYYAEQRKDGVWVGHFVKSAENDKGESVIITDYDRSRSYNERRFTAVPVFSNDKYGVLVTYIKAGQFIPVHSPDVDLIFHVFKGTGTATVDETEVMLKPGSLIIVPRGKKRGIKATTDIEGLHIVVPFPSEGDHEEVERKLASGKYA
jgi:quercetin dioxygenase-like cupin family protein